MAIDNPFYGPLIGSGLSVDAKSESEMLSLAGNLPRWFILLLVAGLGIISIYAATFISNDATSTILKELGVALLIAPILAFTIDRWMKDELRENAVKSTINSIIRPEFHSELQRIFHYEFLCESHNMLISIESISENEVRVTAAVERRLRNISGGLKKIPGSLHIDEWGFSNKCSIEQCSIQHQSGTLFEKFKTFCPNAYSIKAETEALDVQHGELVISRSKIMEIRRKNDHFVNTFSNLTKDPRVVINLSDDLEYEFDFGRTLVAGEKVEHSTHMREHHLIGMFFPGLYMKARWWPKGWSAAPADQQMMIPKAS
jgi:hypothetical protein